MRVPSLASLRFAVPTITGREVVIALIVIVVWLALVGAPVLYEILTGTFGKIGKKTAPTIFLSGLAVLLVGIGFDLGILDIIGGAMVGSVILGIIAMNYLRPADRASHRLAQPPADAGIASVTACWARPVQSRSVTAPRATLAGVTTLPVLFEVVRQTAAVARTPFLTPASARQRRRSGSSRWR